MMSTRACLAVVSSIGSFLICKLTLSFLFVFSGQGDAYHHKQSLYLQYFEILTDAPSIPAKNKVSSNVVPRSPTAKVRQSKIWIRD